MADKLTEPQQQAAHRWYAAECNNQCWGLTTTQRTAEQDAQMLHMAHAAAYHWAAVGETIHHMRATSCWPTSTPCSAWAIRPCATPKPVTSTSPPMRPRTGNWHSPTPFWPRPPPSPVMAIFTPAPMPRQRPPWRPSLIRRIEPSWRRPSRSCPRRDGQRRDRPHLLGPRQTAALMRRRASSIHSARTRNT